MKTFGGEFRVTGGLWYDAPLQLIVSPLFYSLSHDFSLPLLRCDCTFMYRLLGGSISRRWPFFLAVWFVLLSLILVVTPEWKSVIGDGEFRYLPDDSPSKQGGKLFQESFSNDLLGSSIVIVLRRESSEEGLGPRDRKFLQQVLLPRLQKIAKEETVTSVHEGSGTKLASVKATATKSENNIEMPVITSIRTPDDLGIGDLLISADNRAMLVILELRTEFQEQQNAPVIHRIEKLLDRKQGKLYNAKNEENRVPAGLDLALSGSAIVGRDMLVAAEESADSTHIATLILVVILLLLIYRAPFLVLVPIVTVGVSVQLAISLLSLLAAAGYVQLFTGIDIYVKVVMYGAGVDYCMFLMARYKEELDAGASYDEAIAAAVANVGSALVASAGTTMAGIGMMVFAQFGKFQQAGIAMSFSLFFVLAASLTLAPAMLRLAGRWAFWPQMRSERISATSGWVSPTSLVARLLQSNFFRRAWEKIGEQIKAKPGTIWLVSFAMMLPFAVIGVMFYNTLSFGLLSELPQSQPSVIGAHAVQDHFPAGATGPVTVLVKNTGVNFREPAGIQAIRELSNQLEKRKDELAIADIRSVANPFGITRQAKTAEENVREKAVEIAIAQEQAKQPNKTLDIFRRAGIIKRANEIALEKSRDPYISNRGSLVEHVTRIEIIFKDDPFSRDMISRFDTCREMIAQLMPEMSAGKTELHYIGATPNIRDLKTVTGEDQIRIDFLVIGSVFLILVLLLRQVAVSAYLIVSVFFSYLVTLGVTFAVFWALDPEGFAGLDWKVPMFLFTILIAVGEDYNIYLMTRIREEQKKHGAINGITTALSRTGSIISSCGLIMAGTFSSLMFGSLTGMQQLGFALAFGVLLDTFVVRPILVPTYLILLHNGRFGKIGKFLGAETEQDSNQQDDQQDDQQQQDQQDTPPVSLAENN